MIIVRKRTAIIVCAVAIAAVIAIVCALPSCNDRLGFESEFYYVCYVTPTNSHSASSMSSVVYSYGGAGYVVECGGEYFVTVACYYSQRDADSVVKTLGKKGLECKTVKVTAGDYDLPLSAKRKKEAYIGNLNTMLTLSQMCYNLANSLDDGSYGQSAAKTVLGDVNTTLQSLLRQNGANCFARPLSTLVGECQDAAAGIVLSRDVRRLQIAIIDEMVNINLR